MKKILFLILIGLSFCAQSQSTYQPKAINLYKKAITILTKEPGNRDKKLQRVNLILDSAIKIDPQYPLPYQLKMTNLISLKEYKRAIRMADSAIKVKPFLELLTTQGALLQKTGSLSEAKKSYDKALALGQADYKAKPSAGLVCNIAVVYLLNEGSQKALTYLKKEKLNFANDPKSTKQINAFEKELPKLTVDQILGIRAPVAPPPNL